MNKLNAELEALYRDSTFWEEYIKTEFFNTIEKYLKENKMSRSDLAKKLGVSRGYISQVMNGENDHRLSKLVELATAIGRAPYLYLKDMDTVIENANDGKSVFIDFEKIEDYYSSCESEFDTSRDSELRSYIEDIKEANYGSSSNIIRLNPDQLDYGYAIHG